MCIIRVYIFIYISLWCCKSNAVVIVPVSQFYVFAVLLLPIVISKKIDESTVVTNDKTFVLKFLKMFYRLKIDITGSPFEAKIFSKYIIITLITRYVREYVAFWRILNYRKLEVIQTTIRKVL